MIYFSETFSFKGEINLKCKQMKWRKKILLNILAGISRKYNALKQMFKNQQPLMALLELMTAETINQPFSS